MADQYYDSDLTGQQLDAAFAKMANIDTYVSQAASSASEANSYAETATSAAGQAQTYAGQAITAKNNAQTYAGQASDSADSAQTYAGQASGSASAAAASAASIEGDVEAAANSASQAATSASQAAESASDAADAAQTADDAKSTVQQSASAAQTAATQAAQSAQDAQSAATQASGSASTAQSAATLIEDNLEAIQAAPTNAQAAQTSAQAAEASAAAAEAAADRAEQIADFDPADFATAAQGALAESAVQSVNEKSGTAVTLTPADIGAATAAQGAKADTAVQPATLASYALKSEVPTTPADIGAATAAQGTKADSAVQSVNGAKPDSSGNVQLDLTTGTVRSVNGKDPDGSGNVQLSAGDVGAATAAQGALADSAVQPADLNGYAQTSDIPTELPNPQSLGIRLGSAGSLTAYDGSIARTITITPEAIGAQPAGASSGGELTLLYNNKSVTTFNPGERIGFNAAGYDAIGIVSRHRASDDFYSPMQIFEFNNEPYSTCILYAVGITSSYGPEISARKVAVSSGSIVAQGRGQYYNWGNHAADDGACIPVQVWGIKF